MVSDMKAFYDFAQRSSEWHAIRWGRITGTDLKTIMTGGHRAIETLAKRKRYELANPPEVPEEINAPSLAWGRQHEGKAAARYEMLHDTDLLYPAFIIHPVHDFIGVSPDGISTVSTSRRPISGVEIKCPYNQAIHSTTLNLGMPIDHFAQVQGNIWVAGFEHWDFISYDSRQPVPRDYYEQRIDRDEGYISKMERKCLEFWDLVNSDREIGELPDELPQLF